MPRKTRKCRKRQKKRGGTLKYPPYIPEKLNLYRSTRLTQTIPDEPFVQSIRNTYNIEIKELSKGTRLYRSGFESDPMDFFKTKSGILYFGLDAYISIWYALELWQRFKKDRHTIPASEWFVYMHEYKVIEPISYEYMPDIDENPADKPYLTTCSQSACVHPQRIFHSQFGELEEIGTELTIPHGSPLLQQIRPIQSYKINLLKLLEVQDKLSYNSYPHSMENVLTPI